MQLAANVFTALMGLAFAGLGIFVFCVGVSTMLNAFEQI